MKRVMRGMLLLLCAGMLFSCAAPARESVVIVKKAFDVDTAAPGSERSAPESDTPAPETTAPAPETTTPVPETTTPVPETTTPVPETTAPVPETTAPVPETAAPAPETAAPAPETAAPAPETAAPAPETAAPAPETGVIVLETNPPEGAGEVVRQTAEETYVLNKNTKKFHRPDCRSVAQIREKNRAEFTGDREELIAQGYSPCKICHP